MATKSNYSNIHLSLLQIRPYDSSSKLAHEFPGLEYFDDRTDFILFRRVNHVAVCFRAENLLYCVNRGRDVRESFHINICDVTTGATVTSRTISIRMSGDLFDDFMRFDVPLTESQICPDHDYKVVVYHPSTDMDLVSAPLRFFNPQKLPTRYFEAESGYLWSGDPDEFYRGLYGNPAGVAFAASFMLKNDTFTSDRIPQIDYRMVKPDGSEVTGWCAIENLDDHKENGYLLVTAPQLHFASGDFCSGTYYVELRCMGYPFCAMVFTTSEFAEPGTFSADELHIIRPYTVEQGDAVIAERLHAKKKAEEDERRRKVASEFDEMVGLESVKKKIQSYAKLMKFNQRRREAELPVVSTPLHCMFMGSPGTGKTTVAKIMGQILRDTGMLSVGHVVVRERATLLGQFYNSEAEKTIQALEEAQGGILFIDEAYQLHQPSDPKDPGKFVIETLMTALADESKRDWMLILAGYSEPMKKMFEMNPGLASRIPQSNFYHFEDFSSGELIEIAERYIMKNEYELSSEARVKLVSLLESDYEHRDAGFGNARHVMNVIQTMILPAMAERIAEIESPSRDDLTLILPEDIPAPDLNRPSLLRRRIGFAS